MNNRLHVASESEARILESAQSVRNWEMICALADNLPQFVCLRDHDMRFIYVNHLFEKWIGVSREETIGKNVYDLFPADEAAAFDALDQKVLQSGQVHTREVEITYPDGITRTVIGTRFAVKAPDGSILGLGLISTDISEQKAVQKKLADANAELQDLNAMKNRFLGIAAHDLRNPIGAVRGISDIILKLDLSDDKKDELLGSMREVCDNMLVLLDDLLDVSAIESGSFDLRLQQGNLAELLKERIKLAEYSVQEKGITFEIDVADVSDTYFDGDRIGQVLDNILANAAKFSPLDGTVKTRVHSEKDKMVTVVIRDHGEGIPEAEIPGIFTPFARLSSKPTAGEKSTGLGMAIVKKIVDAHNGTINVENASDGGLIVSIDLPVN